MTAFTRSRDRLRLHEIDPLVEIRAQRELARLCEPRTVAHRLADDRLQQHGTAVRADLGDVLAGVRMRRGEKGDDDAVDRGGGGS